MITRTKRIDAAVLQVLHSTTSGCQILHHLLFSLELFSFHSLYSRDWKNFGCQALFRKSRILQINNFKTLILEYKLEQETENQLYVICEM